MKVTFQSSFPKTLKKGEAILEIAKQDIDEVLVEGAGYRVRLGIKEEGKLTARKFDILVHKIVQSAKRHKVSTIYIPIDFNFKHLNLTEADFIERIVVNAMMADYVFDTYKSKKEATIIAQLVLVGKVSKEGEQAAVRGLLVGGEVNKTRDLANTPGLDMTPKVLAAKAKEAVKGLPVKVTIFGEAEMKKMKMGGVLAVGMGSKEESQFIILEYKGGKATEKPAVFVGKGVTFDTGGYSLKPADYMGGMHMDMSGGAAVIHAVALAARLKLKVNVVGLVPSVENSVSGEAFRPGDIIRMYSGTTVEVLNTDAEGRLILADALTYAKKYNPAYVVDCATLTGAALVALGDRMSGLVTPDDNLAQRIEKVGNETGEYVWRLPMWEEHEEDMRGIFADLANIPTKNSRYAGTITAAAFLWHFAKDYPWAHLDIAPRMEASSDEFLAKGSVGSPVRLLVKLLEK